MHELVLCTDTQTENGSKGSRDETIFGRDFKNPVYRIWLFVCTILISNFLSRRASEGAHLGESRCMAKPRGVPGILALVTLGVTACIALRFLSRYTSLVAFRSSSKTTEKTNVLIIAHGRTGSSFLGQIFNSHPDVFYIYEPLITFQLTSMRNSNLYGYATMRLLRDIFNCRFKQQTEFLSFMSHFHLNRFSSRALTLPYCKNITNVTNNRTYIHCKDLDPLITSLSCALHGHTVVKILAHRLPFLEVDRLAPLFSSGGGKLKIVHLMRDPRAVIASMDRVGWSLNKSAINTAATNFPLFTTLVQKFCSSMIQSLRFALSAEGRLPDHYTLLRYEDLVSSPLNASQELFDFAGIPMSDQVKKYLVNSANQSRDRGYTHEYGTLRNNASNLVDTWRTRLSMEAVRAVETHCWPVLEILRYTPVFSRAFLDTWVRQIWQPEVPVEIKVKKKPGTRRLCSSPTLFLLCFVRSFLGAGGPKSNCYRGQGKMF